MSLDILLYLSAFSWNSANRIPNDRFCVLQGLLTPDPELDMVYPSDTSDANNEELALEHSVAHGNVHGNGAGTGGSSPGTTTAPNGDNKVNQRHYEPDERFIITKNVVVIGLAFMIHFTAFHGTSNLQSSVNADKALGTTTLAVIYGSLILSNIFLPMTVIR